MMGAIEPLERDALEKVRGQGPPPVEWVAGAGAAEGKRRASCHVHDRMPRYSTGEEAGADVIGTQGGGRRGSFWHAVVLATTIATGASAERIEPAMIRVIDGDTIELQGQSVRLVGFDTPETWKPRCDYERALGQQATKRLVELIGSGRGVDVVMLPGLDRYRRGLGRLFIANVDVSEILVSEGLARPYEGGRRQGWCG